MKNKYNLILALLILLVSCEEGAKTKELRGTKEVITFNVGLPTRNMYAFNSDNIEYLAFVDFTSYRRAEIRSLNNEYQTSISFKELMEEENISFNAFYPISIDSFALLTKYTNKIFVLDSLSHKIYQKDYSKYLLKGIEMYPPIEIRNNRLITGKGYWPEGYESMTDLELAKIRNNSFNILEDENFSSKSNNLNFRLDSLYSRFTMVDEWPIEGLRITPRQDNLLFISSYTDSLYLFDSNYKLSKIKTINSRYYKHNLKATKIIDAQLDNDLVTYNFWNHSFISRVLYDSYNKLYYCFARGPHINKEFPFSIIVLDEELNQLTERKFSEKEYKPNGFVSKNGLYLERQLEDLKTRSFELINYE